MSAAALWLYGLAMRLARPLLRCHLRRRGGQEPLYLESVPERFGLYLRPAPEGPGPRVWVHAVSLGETRTAALLLPHLRAQWPGMRLLLTHGTATGRTEGLRLLREGDVQAWLPWDDPQAVTRFLDHFRPALGLLMETEVWPTLVAQCRRQHIPLALVSARMSRRSQLRAQRLPWLSRAAFGDLAAVWAQTPDDARRLAELGAVSPRVLGNLKFDAQPDAAQLAQGRALRAAAGRPVILLASSRDREEAALLQIIQTFWASSPVEQGKSATNLEADQAAPQWLIVPRHPQRFDAVADLLRAAGLRVARRSAGGVWPPPAAADGAPTIWLGDTLGEMALYYGLSDVALLGGSFEPLGGQNLIEAAACACPVVMGPHTFNFAQAADDAEAAQAACRVPSLEAAVALARELLADRPRRAAMAHAGEKFTAAHAGAANRVAVAAAGLLSGDTARGTGRLPLREPAAR
ncbi:MAG: 3-deoxy-D-manno-octulosonic acid transferase [Rhodoferax sp.]|nr:3-deoxy-D-manno-octulosonic acid transferase [Rhodoferax sp.]